MRVWQPFCLFFSFPKLFLVCFVGSTRSIVRCKSLSFGLYHPGRHSLDAFNSNLEGETSAFHAKIESSALWSPNHLLTTTFSSLQKNKHSQYHFIVALSERFKRAEPCVLWLILPPLSFCDVLLARCIMLCFSLRCSSCFITHSPCCHSLFGTMVIYKVKGINLNPNPFTHCVH